MQMILRKERKGSFQTILKRLQAQHQLRTMQRPWTLTLMLLSKVRQPEKCHAMPCCAMLCHAMPCHAMPCHAMPCCAMLCHAMLCHAMPCYAMLCYAMLCCQSEAATLAQSHVTANLRAIVSTCLTLHACVADIMQGKRATHVATIPCHRLAADLFTTSMTQPGIIKLDINKKCGCASPTGSPSASSSLPVPSITMPLGWVEVETVIIKQRIQCSVACCNAVPVLGNILHGACDCARCDCTATPDIAAVTVHECNAVDGNAEMSSQAPVPLGGPAMDGSMAWAQPPPNASSKLFKVVLRSHHGWQLDGHVRASFTPQAIMNVVMTMS